MSRQAASDPPLNGHNNLGEGCLRSSNDDRKGSQPNRRTLANQERRSLSTSPTPPDQILKH